MIWSSFSRAYTLAIKVQKNGFIASLRKKNIENLFGSGSLATKSGGSG